MWTIHAIGNNDGKLACNPGEKNIGFCGGVVTGFSSGNTHIDFQMVDGTFYNSSDFVKGIPFFGIPLNTWKHTEIQVFVCISGTSFDGGGTRVFAVADIFPFCHVLFGKLADAFNVTLNATVLY